MDDLNSDMEVTDDLRSILGDAYDKALQNRDETPKFDESQTSENHEETPAPVGKDGESQGRDESGRFSKKDEAHEAAEPEASAPEEKPIDAPEGWTAAQKIEWDKLPPSAQKIISEREMSFKQVQDKLKQFDPLEERLARHDSQLSIAGTTRTQFLNNLIAAHEALLRDGPAALMTVARQYGIDPRALAQTQQAAQQQPQQQPSAENQRLAALEAQVQSYQQAQVAAQEQAIQSQINEFSSAREGDALKHPHFNDVRPMMGALLQAGQAQTLGEAYDMACRAHPDVSRRIAEAARLAEQRQQQRVAEEAKRKAASISGAPQSRGTSAASDGDLRSIIVAAMDDATR